MPKLRPALRLPRTYGLMKNALARFSNRCRAVLGARLGSWFLVRPGASIVLGPSLVHRGLRTRSMDGPGTRNHGQRTAATEISTGLKQIQARYIGEVGPVERP